MRTKMRRQEMSTYLGSRDKKSEVASSLFSDKKIVFELI